MLELTEFEFAALLLSLKVAVVSVLICLPLGLAAAWLLARVEFYGKSAVDAVFHLPLVVPPVVVGYLLLILFGRSGPLGSWLYTQFGISIAFTWKGAAIAAAVMAFPLMVRAMRLSLENAWCIPRPRIFHHYASSHGTGNSRRRGTRIRESVR